MAELPTEEELESILGRSTNAGGIFFRALGTVGYCADHSGVAVESSRASDLAHMNLARRMLFLSQRGSDLMEGNPDYMMLFDNLVESGWKNERAQAAVAAYDDSRLDAIAER